MQHERIIGGDNYIRAEGREFHIPGFHANFTAVQGKGTYNVR